MPFLPTRDTAFQKKIVKKLKKLKNIILTIFLTKTDKDRMKKRQKLFITEYSLDLTLARAFSKKFRKIIKIIKKKLKISFSPNFKPNRVRTGRKRDKNKYLSWCRVSPPEIRHSKKKNCEETKKYHYHNISNQNGQW